MPGRSGSSRMRSATRESTLTTRSYLPGLDGELAQLFDPVADRRRLLELEPFRRRAHLLFERTDVLPQRTGGHLGDLEQPAGPRVVVVQVGHLHQRVVDLLE